MAGGQILTRVHLPPASVHQEEPLTDPFGGELPAIAGHTRRRLDHGRARPMIRLTSVDFPTLGRPTTATTGKGVIQPHSQHSRGLRTSFGVRETRS